MMSPLLEIAGLDRTSLPRSFTQEVPVQTPRIRFFARVAGMALMVFGSTGCAFYGAGHTSSPWEWGGGGRIVPGLWTLAEGTTLHPLGSYTYLSFDGGHDDLFELGAQIRYRTTALASQGGLWIAGEAGYARVRTEIDNFGSSSLNGWMLAASAGVPVGTNRWGPSIFVGAGLVGFEGSTGKNIRAGVDLQPWFVKRNSPQ